MIQPDNSKSSRRFRGPKVRRRRNRQPLFELLEHRTLPGSMLLGLPGLIASPLLIGDGSTKTPLDESAGIAAKKRDASSLRQAMTYLPGPDLFQQAPLGQVSPRPASTSSADEDRGWSQPTTVNTDRPMSDLPQLLSSDEFGSAPRATRGNSDVASTSFSAIGSAPAGSGFTVLASWDLRAPAVVGQLSGSSPRTASSYTSASFTDSPQANRDTTVSPVTSSSASTSGNTVSPAVQPQTASGAVNPPVPSGPASSAASSQLQTSNSGQENAQRSAITKNLGFDAGLGGWTISEIGGSGPGRGSVTAGSAILREGNSFSVAIEQSFLIPEDPHSLSFTYSAFFDTTDPDSINDAFEAVLEDRNGAPLAYTYTPNGDAFFNVTEELPEAAGKNVSLEHTTEVEKVTVDISGLLPGTEAKLRFQLVNNDSDTATMVEIFSVDLVSGGVTDLPPEVTVGLQNDTAPQGSGIEPFQTDLLTNDSRVRGTATDDKGVDRLAVKVDDGTFVDITASLSNGQFNYDPGTMIPGQHQITIRATDAAAQSTDALLNFRVNAPPSASAGGQRSVDEGTTVSFDGSGSSDEEGPIFGYAWTFHDGSTQAGVTASYEYVHDGTYPVTLTVVDIAGSIVSDVIVVKANDLAPTAAFTWTPDPQAEGSAIQFSDASTSFPDTIVGWQWGFGTEATSTQQNPSYTFPGNGTYEVTLTVRDEDGSTDTITHTVTVTDLAPQAAFTWAPEPQAEGSAVQFTDGSTSSPDTIVGWQWDFGGLATSTNRNPSYAFPDDGNYLVTLTVTDKDGSTDTVSHTVSVSNVAPAVQLGPDATIVVGGAYGGSGRFTDPGTDVWTATVDYGDGSGVQGLALNTDKTFALSHVYNDEGSYVVLVTVTDDSGLAGSDTLTVTATGDASLYSSIYVLSPTVSGAMSLTGNGIITVPGRIQVDSNSSAAMIATGNASVIASSIDVVGGFRTTSNAVLSPTPRSGAPFIPDPLAGLAAPVAGPSRGSVNLSKGTRTIDPGVYGEIKVSGTGQLILRPGVYSIAGGGFSISGQGSVTGSEVLIYNAGSNFPNPGGTFGTVKVSGQGKVQLSAATIGLFAGITIFQARDNKTAISLSGQADLTNASGLIYAPVAELEVTGTAQLSAALIVDRLDFSGNGSIFVHPSLSSPVGQNKAGVTPIGLFATNPRNAVDVNDDGIATPLDVLLLINALNQAGQGGPAPDGLYLDVNNDGFVSPVDVLLAINSLNRSTVRSSSVSASNTTPSGLLPATAVVSQPLAIAEGETVVTEVAIADMPTGGETDYGTLSIGIDDGRPASSLNGSKFFVVDAAADSTFGYGPQGEATGRFSLDAATGDPRGIASNAEGDMLWVIDAASHRVSVRAADGSLLGSWLAEGLQNPQGIATDGSDIWIVDEATDQVLRYTGAGSLRSGALTPDRSFSLHVENTSPSDLVTDGSTVWVTDDQTDEVFVSDTASTLLGRWRLDPANADASGITKEPSGGTDLWVVDRMDRLVYHYTAATTFRSGSPAAVDTFSLVAANMNPEGIADPPPQTPEGDTLLDASGRAVFTTSDDFLSGTLFNVNAAEISGDLRLNPPEEIGTYPYLWVPNENETVSKIDTRTGNEVARYHTGPLEFDGEPSRTTVDLDGNCYVANRYAGSVVKFGHNEWVDRNHNGVLDTSADLDGDGTISGSEILPWGQDERVLYEMVLIPGRAEGVFVPGTYAGGYVHDWTWPGPRTVAIDAQNRLWVGAYGSQQFYVINGATGQIQRSFSVSPWGHNAYGGVVDSNGMLWSASISGNHVLRIDTKSTTNPPAISRINVPHLTYGLGLDQAGHLFVNGWTDNAISRININTGEIEWTKWYDTDTVNGGRGIAVLPNGDFFAVSSNGNFVTRFDNNGNKIVTIPVGAHPTGAAVDNYGKAWVCDIYDEDIRRIDPATNTVDLTKQIVGSGGHYTYSDMTGRVLLSQTRTGNWSEIVDSQEDDKPWGTVALDSQVPTGSSLRLRVRASDDRELLSSVAWTDIQSGLPLHALRGRYLQVEATLQSTSPTATPSVQSINLAAVADPQITRLSPEGGSSLPAGSEALISGIALADTQVGPGPTTIPNRIVQVSVNGQPVDVLDASGNFFARVNVPPGQSVFELSAVDAFGQTAATTLTLSGVQPTPGQIDFSLFSDVSASFTGEYGRTSFNEDADVLYADMAIRNAGQYSADTPLLVGITNISDPGVRVQDPDGVTPDGVPYYDFTELVDGATLESGERTGERTLAFYDPDKIQFTYDLIFLGKLNQAPTITTVPDVEALAGHPYRYDIDAEDPDLDSVSFQLLVGPTDASIDPVTGEIAWTPSATDKGQHSVVVRVEDGRGGSAEQHYTLSVIDAPPNRPPQFTSVPVVDAFVNQPYVYDADAFDPDADLLTFADAERSSTTSIEVANPGFEAQYLADGSWINGVISQWVVIGNGGPYNPSSSLFPGGVAPEGQNAAFSNGGTISQVLSAALTGGVEYSLRVQVGERLEVGFPGYAIQLWAGGKMLGQDTSQDPAAGTFVTSTVQYSVGPDDPLIGQLLEIRLVSLGLQVSFDDVQLTATTRSVGLPDGLSVDSQTGGIQWTPTSDQAGVQEVTLMVTDGRGGTATQSFAVRVYPAPGNHPPVIVSEPGPAFEGYPYSYDVEATDSDNDPLTYSLPNATVPFAIDPTTGVITLPNADPNPKPEWTVSAAYVALDVSTDRRGDVYVTGVFSDTVDFDSGPADVTLTSAGGRDVFVAKYSPAHELIWARRVGGPDDDWAHTEVVDNEGSVYIVGQFQQTVDFDPGPGARALTAAGSVDAFLMKLDTAGNFVWAQSAGSTGIDLATGVAVDNNGDVFAVGFFQSTVDFDPGAPIHNITSTGNMGAFVWSLDQRGQFRWVQRINGGIRHGVGGSGHNFNVTADKANNVLVTGYFSDGIDFEMNTGTTHLTSAGEGDVFLAKFDSSGSFIWADRIGGTSYDANGHVATDSAGNVYLDGFFVETIDVDPGPNTHWLTSAGGYDTFVVKLDAAGDFVWARRSGDVGSENAYGIAVDRFGNVYASSNSELSKLDSQGNVVWTYPVGGYLAVDCQGSAYLWGGLVKLAQAGGTVRVDDGKGGFDTQCFCLDVRSTPPGEIRGTTFNDTDGDGIRDTGENVLSNWTIFLDENRNGERDPGERFTTTNANGDYTLTNLPPGTYVVAEENESGWRPTTPATGVYEVALSAGLMVTGKNFGNSNAAAFNRNPEFTTNAPTVATTGQPLGYDAKAQDPDRDPLMYDLTVSPAGMVVDANMGKLVWVPTANQVGVHDVVLRVQDGRGGVALQSFQITVSRPNSAPVISSRPSGPAVAGVPWHYQVRSQDADGDTVTFRLDEKPDGMQIDSATGLVTWMPTAAQVGAQYVEVTADDGRGGAETQAFDLPVVATAPNDSPQITSAPRGTIRLGSTYLYQVLATDPNSDSLSYSLTTKPAGMSIDAAGLVTWTPASDQLGPQSVQVLVEDGRGGWATQGFSVTVATQDTNRPPSIVSTPPFTGIVGREYSYDITAADPDGDPVFFGLDAAPGGMSIDPSSGTLRWTPTVDQLGAREVIVRATDSRGAFTRQTYSITVRSVNLPPNITSAPPTTAAVGENYSYAVRALDPENDPLSIFLAVKPNGMTIDGAGFIRWTPDAAQVGSQNVTVRVEDGQGSYVTQSYSIAVAATSPNEPPVITSAPPLVATVGQVYQYSVTATDPNGETPQFSLLAFPDGLTIESVSGLIQWTPTPDQIGLQNIVVAAIDMAGSAGTQSFSVSVVDSNRAPDVISSPVQTVTAGLAYRYDVRASDPDGDPVHHTLTGPAGMTIDTLGRVTWSPSIADIGVHRVDITVADSRGLSIMQSYDVAVLADRQTPRINLFVSQNPVELNSLVTFVVTATDNVKVASVGLTINGSAVPLDAAGRISLIAGQAGSYSIVASASDAAGNTGLASTTLTVIDTSDTEAPDVAISSPQDYTVVTAPIDVRGTVDDPEDNLDYYTLSVAPIGTEDFVEQFRGYTEVSGGVLGKFDPTGLVNGTYRLRLSATDKDGNTSLIENVVEVAGDLKVGNFTLSFTDLSIPVSGIPITVTRTYDSLTAGQRDDLGYGWRLEFRDTDLRTSVSPSGAEEYGYYTPFREGSRVYLTVPGGRREGFTFQPRRMSGFGGIFFFEPQFVPDAGVTSRLSSANATLTANDFGEYYATNGLAYNPSDALNFGGEYYLTTQEGLAYTIDAQSGDLLSVADTNSNTLTFSDTSIDHSTGKRITFDRDPQGRIIAVNDPAGQQIRYQYNGEGDLVKVIDRNNSATTFIYDEPLRPHFLTEVIDPLGRSGVRSEYDAQGRLVTLIDADGNPVKLAHDPDNSIETITDALGHSTTYEYDLRGNVVTEVDAEGGITARTYDAGNNLLTETDPLGNTTSFSYDSYGNTLTETDSLGNVTRFTYLTAVPGRFERIRGARPVSYLVTTTDPLGNTTRNTYVGSSLTSTTDAAGNVTRYTYDAAGNQTSITDAADHVTAFQYDEAGNLTSQTDAFGNATTFAYDANGNQLSQTTIVTTPSGARTLVTTTQYDASGHPTIVTDAEGHTTRTEYDALGNQQATIDALGRRTEFVYDGRGQLVSTVFADGTSTSMKYDALGRRTSSTDRAERVTRFVYDAMGWLTETIYPDATPDDDTDNPRTSTEYDAAGRVTAQIDELGHRTEFEYDAAGRQTVIRDALGHETTTVYDAAGRRTAQSDALDRTTQFVYDTLGRQVRTVFADGTSTSTDYDALGRSISETDQSGRVTHFEYGALGRLTAVVDALGQRTEYSYDEASNLIVQRDANSHETRYEHDGLGRRIATELPLSERSATSYDAVGNVATATDFNGDTTTYHYDSNNRLISKTFLGGNSVAFTYTPTGQRETVVDASGVTKYEYDERDRLVLRTDPDNASIAYTYDATGNRTSSTTTVPGNPRRATTYTFDALNRLTSVTDPEDGLTEYSYDAVGNLVRTELPNSTVETREYNTLNRLTYLESRNLTTTEVLSSYRYTLDPSGNRTAVAEQDGRHVEYDYDELYRLVGESIFNPGITPIVDPPSRTIDYTYDAVGNRLTRADSLEGTTTYTYDDNDRLLTETLAGDETRYTYDANGNTLSRTNAADSVFYDWDYENRLIATDNDGDGTNDVEYRYNADGIRISSTTGREETRYLIDTSHPFAQVVEDYTSGGVIRVSYVHGLDLISQNRPAENGKSFYHVDGLGSTRALTNALGLVTDRYIYDAFGQTIGQVGSTGNVYLFAGEQRDLATGLDYLRARWMNTGVGRFFGRDPFTGALHSPATLHRFIYGNDNPVGYVDPGGESVFAVGLTSVAVLGILSLRDPVMTLNWAARSLPARATALAAITGFLAHGWSNAANHLKHFVFPGGVDPSDRALGPPLFVDLGLVMREDGGVGQKVAYALLDAFKQGRYSGILTIQGGDFANEDWHLALGGFNINWSVNGNQATLSFKNMYQWHPEKRQNTQDIHRAMFALKNDGAKDYYMYGLYKYTLQGLSAKLATKG